MDSKFSHILVGIFVLLIGAALIAGVIWLSTYGPEKEYSKYLVYMTESVSGLSEDAPVKYRGVDVGKVQKIDLVPHDPERIRVEVRIQSDVVIRENDRASLESQGVTGITYLNIIGGSGLSKALPRTREEPYPVIKTSPSLLGRLDAILSILSENLTITAGKLNEFLSDSNRSAISQTLRNTETLTRNLAIHSQGLDSIMKDVRVTVKNTREASERAPAVLRRLERSIAGLEQMSQELKTTALEIRQTSRTSGRDIQRFTGDSLPQASQIISELRQTIENLRRLSENLAQDPSVIIYGPTQRRLGPGE